MANVDWDLATFTDARGRLGKPVDTGMISVPRTLRIEDQFLVWDHAKFYDEEPRWCKPAKSMLEDFVKLWQGDPEGVLRYARQHGPLSLNEEGIPSSLGDASRREHMSKWDGISRRACAVLNIAAALAQDRLGSAEDWRIVDNSLDASFPNVDNAFGIHGLSAARMYFGWELDKWAIIGQIRLSVAWNPRRHAWVTEIDFYGRPFAALALQLLLTVADADSLYNCDGCKLPYPQPRSLRRPKPGQANFCQQCGKQAALRHADLRRKSRIRQARQFYAEGMSVARIARQLNAAPPTVGRWVKLIRR